MNICKYITLSNYALSGCKFNANPLRNDSVTTTLISVNNVSSYETQNCGHIIPGMTSGIGQSIDREKEIISTQLKSISNISCHEVEDWSGASSGLFISKKRTICN